MEGGCEERGFRNETGIRIDYIYKSRANLEEKAIDGTAYKNLKVVRRL